MLVGLMGAGKTTIGRRLAEALKLGFVDADQAIEAAAKRTVSEIFEAYGEAGFREGERRVIARLLGEPPQVIATGGGAFVNDETRSLIKRTAISIWLKADLDTLMERVLRRDTRPLLRTPDPRATMAALMAEREAAYAQADIHVESVNTPHEKTVAAIIEALRGRRTPMDDDQEAAS